MIWKEREREREREREERGEGEEGEREGGRERVRSARHNACMYSVVVAWIYLPSLRLIGLRGLIVPSDSESTSRTSSHDLH